MARQAKAHFLSKFFLAGFTMEGTDNGFLWATSKSTGRKWRARAAELAHVRDLYRTEGQSLEPEAIELAFAAIETEVAPILKSVVDSRALPSGDNLDLLLHLVALNASRPPGEIAQVEQHVDEDLRRSLVKHLTPERHSQALEEWRASGRSTAHVENLADLRERILAGHVRAVMPRDYLLVGGVLGRATTLVELLGQRFWTLLVAPEGTHFICSDRPVNLLNNVNIPATTEARYTDHRFDVVAPLSRQLCLIGRATGMDRTTPASQRTVGFINHITNTAATDYVYSTEEMRYISDEAAHGRENGDAYRKDLCQR